MLGGDGCVWYMVCDDMVGVGWAGKGGTGRWIEGLLGFVVWSGMHECSCSAVLLIAFSSCCPPPPSPFAVVVQYTSIRSVFSPINITSQTQPPLSTVFPIPAHPSAPLYHNSQFPTPRQNPSHLLTSPSHPPSNYLRPTKLFQEEKSDISFS